MSRGGPRRPRPSRPSALARAAAALTLALAACAGDPAPPAEADTGADAGADTGADAGCSLPGSSFQQGPPTTTEDFQISVPLGTGGTGAVTVRGTLVVPGSCSQVQPCPLVVVVGDREGSPQPDWIGGARRLATATEAIVAIWNLPGLGIGGHQADGEDDFGGNNHVTAVKQVMHTLAKRDHVDPARTGFLTVGYGLVATAAALKKFAQSSLSQVLFLIDVEGPSDRCAASQAPEDASRSVGPGDGPGASEGACNFSATLSHAAAYPVGAGGLPSSIVCAPGAWPITLTGQDCTAETWWSAREPAKQLNATSVRVRYQRVAFRHDHRMPSKHASRVMLRQIVASKSPYFVLNDMPPCSQPLDDAACAGLAASCQRCWLEGAWGDGLAPAPYAGGQLRPISADALLGDVLPRFVRRMIDVEAFPACR